MPSTPIYSFPYPANVDLVRDGHQDLQDLALAVENKYNVINGLVTLQPSGAHTNISFDVNGVGRPTVGASTFTIADCFSTAYDAYRVTWTGATSTASAVVSVTYPGLTTNYIGNLIYNRPNNASITNGSDNSTFRHTWCGWGGSTIMMDVQVYNPALSTHVTHIYARYIEMNQVAGAALGEYFGYQGTQNANTAITITLDSGVIVNSGTVRVYAYNK